MRILQVNDFPTGGGAEMIVDETVTHLRARGHDVATFTGEDAGSPPGPLAYVHNRRAVRRLAARIAEHAADVVHLHNVYHVLSPAIIDVVAGRADRPRIVLTAHDFHLACPNAGASWFARNGQRSLAEPDRLASVAYLCTRRWDHRSAAHGGLKLVQHLWNHRVRGRRNRLDAVLCPGAAAAGVLRRAGVRSPISVVPNPFDAKAVQSTGRTAIAAPAEWPGGSAADGGRPAKEPLRLAFVGRVAREKGLADLLSAWPTAAAADAAAATSTATVSGSGSGSGSSAAAPTASHGHDETPPPVSLVAVGDGPDLERCQAIVERRHLGDQVAFVGQQPRDRTLGFIAGADALVVPSRSPEVAPIVLLEALALGTPIIASDFGAMRELIDATRAGWLFDPFDAAALPGRFAEILRALAAGDLQRDRAGVQAFLDERRPEAYLDALERIYGGDAVNPSERRSARSSAGT